MPERRRHPRHPVAWPVRLWADTESVVGRAVDASASGIRIVTAPTAFVKAGNSYRVEVMGEPAPRFALVGQVRHVGAQGVGVETRGSLPGDWSRWTAP